MGELFAKVNGTTICYEIHGEGYPLFLLHGFGLTKEFWFAQIPALSKHFKVITPDNRGSGNSDHPKAPYELKTLADDINDLMNFLKIDKAHLIGWATGSMIAQYFILNYSDRVNKLILIASLTKLPMSKSGLEMFKNSQLTFHEEKLKAPEKTFYNKMKTRFTRNFYKLMVQDPKKKMHGIFSAEDLMEIVYKDTSEHHDIENRINAVAKLNTLDQLHNIKSETLILAAEKDRISPKTSSIEVHERVPNSTLKIFNGGHYFPLENAPEVNQTIIDFLR
jgi:pimeloyl-ACP methyl ester carboxylesterase